MVTMRGQATCKVEGEMTSYYVQAVRAWVWPLGGSGTRGRRHKRTVLSHPLPCRVHLDGEPGVLLKVLAKEVLPPHVPICFTDLFGHRKVNKDKPSGEGYRNHLVHACWRTH